MNLLDLVFLSNRLENLTLEDLRLKTHLKFDNIMHEIDVPQEGVDTGFKEELIGLHQTIETSFESFEKKFKQYKELVQKLIDQEGIKWFQNSSVLYEQQLKTRYAQHPDSVYSHKNKPIQLDEETDRIFKTRVSSYNDWHYPAMVIHPMLESFVHGMVGNDPLYLVDESYHLLEPTLRHWDDSLVFKNRLRIHCIEESFDQPILDKIPNGQIGFCLVYNYLNYRPYEIIKKYLTELYDKLKPGGVVAITFNDCDRYQAIQMVEQGISCYTPGSLVKGWAKYLGFKEIFCYQDEFASVWVEFKKPGTLTSLRGGQALAKILPKPVAKSK